MSFKKIIVAGTELISVGVVISVSGLKGALRVHPIFLNPNELNELFISAIELYLEDDGFPKKLTYKKSEVQTKDLVLHCEELTSIDSSEKYLKTGSKNIFIKNSVFTKYLESKNSIIQYFDYQVIDQAKGVLGNVTDLMMGKQDFLVVDQMVIPFVEQLIKNIDKKNKIIITNLPEGFFE